MAAIALFVVVPAVPAVPAVMRVSVERAAAEIRLRMAVGATPIVRRWPSSRSAGVPQWLTCLAANHETIPALTHY